MTASPAPWRAEGTGIFLLRVCLVQDQGHAAWGPPAFRVFPFSLIPSFDLRFLQEFPKVQPMGLISWVILQTVPAPQGMVCRGVASGWQLGPSCQTPPSSGQAVQCPRRPITFLVSGHRIGTSGGFKYENP